MTLLELRNSIYLEANVTQWPNKHSARTSTIISLISRNSCPEIKFRVAKTSSTTWCTY